MLGQRRRRWANINPALFQRLVFAGHPLQQILLKINILAQKYIFLKIL